MKRAKLIEQITQREKLSEHEIFPNFGPNKDFMSSDNYYVVPIPEYLLLSYNQKLVRGMTYVLDKTLIGKDFNIELIVTDPDHKDVQPLQELFMNHASTYNNGIGFIVKRISEERGKAWVYEFAIWQKLKFYSVVQHVSLDNS